MPCSVIFSVFIIDILLATFQQFLPLYLADAIKAANTKTPLRYLLSSLHLLPRLASLYYQSNGYRTPATRNV
jgi:hypothetical protein